MARMMINEPLILFKRILPIGKWRIFLEMLTNGNSCDRQLITSAKIGLHQRTHRPAAEFFGKLA